MNWSIDELFNNKLLSARNFHLCKGQNLVDLCSIIEYYRNNGGFLKIRNCGVKSNDELINLCQKYEDILFDDETQEQVVPIIELQNKHVEFSTPRQAKIIENYLDFTISELSERSKKSLLKLTGDNLTIKGLEGIIVDQNYNFFKIKNIGEKSVEELSLFFENLRTEIERVKTLTDETELIKELFNTFLQRHFSVEQDILDEIWSNYNAINGAPIFKALNILIEEGFIFKKTNEKSIFLKGLNFYKGSDVATLEEIAKICGISRERTRQLRVEILREIKTIFSFLKQIEREAINFYGIDFNADIVHVSEEFVHQINCSENNNYNCVFINIIFSIIYDDFYTLIGDIESIAFNKPDSWKAVYLVKNDLAYCFNFNNFINDVRAKYSQRKESDLVLYFEAYLSKFLLLESFQVDNIEPVAKNILFNEFELFLDENDCIVFKKNTYKQVFEYAREALIELGVPSKVSDICNKILELYPEYPINETNIRAAMQRNNGFISHGMTSTYSLKELGNSKSVRGGTIRAIVEEYLNAHDEPKHLNDITNHVSKFRNTNNHSVLNNLKSDEGKRFVFFVGAMVGIKNKQYDLSNLTNVDDIALRPRTWEESLQELRNFIETHGRLPFSVSENEEFRLYTFYTRQFQKLKNDEIKFEIFSNLVSPYLGQKRKSRNIANLQSRKMQWVVKESIPKNNELHNEVTTEKYSSVVDQIPPKEEIGSKLWWRTFDRLKEYVNTNNTLPKSADDINLYMFCSNCNKKLKAGTFTEKQIQALRDINFMDFTFGSHKSWDELFAELKIFVTENGRWPKVSATINSNEIRLRRFCTSILQDYENDALSDEQLDKLNAINFPLEQGTVASRWFTNYNKLKEFRFNNPNIWPRSRGYKEEKHLYQYCIRNKNKFLNGTLNEYKIKLLKDINFDFYD